MLRPDLWRAKLVRDATIPDAIRGTLWLMLSGSASRLAETPELYTRLAAATAADESLPALPRGFAVVAETADDAAVAVRLRRILAAFAECSPTVTLCPGAVWICHAIVARVPSDENAFCMFLNLVETRGLTRLGEGEELLTTLVGVLELLLRGTEPELAAHFDAHGFAVGDFAPAFFRGLHRQQLPQSTLMRVWDLLIAEDSRVFFTATLALLARVKESLLACDSAEALRGCLLGDGLSALAVSAPDGGGESGMVDAFLALHQSEAVGVEAVAAAEGTFERVRRRTAKAKAEAAASGRPKAEVKWTGDERAGGDPSPAATSENSNDRCTIC